MDPRFSVPKETNEDSNTPEQPQSVPSSPTNSADKKSFQDAVELPCYETFGKGLLVLIHERDGLYGFEADRNLAIQFFQKEMGFEIKEYDNKQSFLEFLHSVQTTVRYQTREYYCLFFLISCHGNKQGMSIGGKIMKMKDMEEMFNNTNVGALYGCPKIFIADFCRGSPPTELFMPKSAASDQYKEATCDSDIMTVYATTKGKMAYRTAYGSVLHKAFIETLNKFWKTLNLDEMITLVKSQVIAWTGTDNKKQTAESRSTCSKVFVFKGAELKRK